jgi:hypothetical protein
MSKQDYAAIRDAYLDGELDGDAAEILFGELTLTAEQQAEWRALSSLEGGLKQLATGADLPWTRLRVETELAGREQARQWLAQHRRGLLGLSGLSLGKGDLRRGLLQALAVIGGGLFGWGVGTLVTASAHAAVTGLPLPLLAAGTAGVATWAVLRWPELRTYFTA